MVQSPDEYTIKRKFWFAMPKEITRILGTVKGLSAERSSFDLLIEAAAEIENAMRAERIGDRLRANQQGSHTSTPQAGNNALSHGTTSQKSTGFSKTRQPFQRLRVRFGDKPTDRGGDNRRPEAASKPSSGSTRPPSPRVNSGTNSDPKGKTPRRGCFNCGSMDHWASDPNCPERNKKPRPVIRRIADESQEGASITHGGDGLEGQQSEQLRHMEQHTEDSDDGDLEGSQLDPDEYPDEEYFSYSESEEYGQGEWMGGMTTTRPSPGNPTEWLGGMRLVPRAALHDESTEAGESSRTPPEVEDQVGDHEDPEEEVVFNLALPHSGYLDDIVLPQRVVQDYRTGWADRLSRLLDDTQEQMFAAQQRSRIAVQEVELNHLRTINLAMVERWTQSQKELTDATQENIQLVNVNGMWVRQCSEMNTELRTVCNAINTGVLLERLAQMVHDIERRQHQRALVRERAFSRITIDPEEDDDDMPPLVDEATFMAERMDRVHRAMSEQTGERLFAILASRDREYRSAMAPKEVRPQRDFKCITVSLDRSPNFRLHKSKVKFYKKSPTKYDFKHLKIVKKCRILAKFDES
ncbi:hypothetical protein QCA50_008795 [Cerrena zonata]|uniref:CCHC-type domain-containing protein n=1 Tax=Cerrena zonata TaxID=2478898 RepID=A0AAW0GEN7_9APHY